MFPLHTERLILRPFDLSDAETFSTYRSDPEVARYQGWDAPYSLIQAQEFIQSMRDVHPGAPGEWLQLAIQLKSSGQVIGDCAFAGLKDVPHQAEIGFSLARAYQGHGYATEAVRRLLAYLFTTFAFHRIRAICDEENLSSARVLERVGMRREGHLIDNVWFKGRWSSEYWYAILRSEWQDRQPGR